MKSHNPKNERIKRQYFTFLKEARRQSEASVDGAAMALVRFEADTGYRDFKQFRVEQAIAFKRHLADARAARTGEALSKATLHATLAHLKRFFQWLAMQPGYRSKIQYSEAEYFNLTENDVRIATARHPVSVPTIEQIRHVINSMPTGSEIALRDRALMAFIILTGARDSAVASAKLKHVDIAGAVFYQDAREVETKFRKSFLTFFFPVGDDFVQIVAEWVIFLREEKFFGNDDPLFPATNVIVGTDRQFCVDGVKREHWHTTAPIRQIFQRAFERAELPYFKPHSFRHALVQFGEKTCRSPEDFKAWSQNLGHEGVMTTFNSYGTVSQRRQREILASLSGPGQRRNSDAQAIAEEVARLLKQNRDIAASEQQSPSPG